MAERLWHDRDPLLAAAYRELIDGIRNGDEIGLTESRIAFVVGLAVGLHERLGALTGPEPRPKQNGARDADRR